MKSFKEVQLNPSMLSDFIQDVPTLEMKKKTSGKSQEATSRLLPPARAFMMALIFKHLDFGTFIRPNMDVEDIVSSLILPLLV